MTQVVSRWPLNSGVRVRSLVSPCGICGEQRDTGTGFFLDFSSTPVKIFSPLLHTHTSISLPDEVFDNSVRVAHYHTLDPKLWV
jgi:hypothetical protein